MIWIIQVWQRYKRNFTALYTVCTIVIHNAQINRCFPLTDTISWGSDPEWLCPRSCAYCKLVNTQTQNLAAHTEPHVQFISETDTPHSPQSQYAELERSSADCGWAASVCSVLGQAGGRWGGLEVGQGFQKTFAAPSQEQLSCLGTQPLNNTHTQTHTACKPLLR